MHSVIVTKLWGAQIFGVGGFKHPYDIIIGTTIARLLGSKGRERVPYYRWRPWFVVTLVSVSPDPPTAKAAPKKATPIHPPKHLSIPLYASTRAISGQMFNICPEIAPKMPQILPSKGVDYKLYE
jgi:hypothetical protein